MMFSELPRHKCVTKSNNIVYFPIILEYKCNGEQYTINIFI
jgi:hypothetical protein